MRIRFAIWAILAALFTPLGSTAGAAQNDRFCSTQGGGPPNCSYSTSEQCRAANQGEGRCVPESWLPKKPTKRVDLERNSVRDIYLGPLGRYGQQDPTQLYDRNSGLNGW